MAETEDSVYYTPADLRPILERLQAVGFNNVIVGGQAVNLWALFYERGDDMRWQQASRPFTSADLDYLGKPTDTTRCARALPGSRYKINRDPGMAGPNTGLVLAPLGDGRLRVDLLGSITGVGTVDAIEDAVTYTGRGELSGLTLRVLHPLHCLESKLASLALFSQRARQDARHTQLSILAVHDWLAELVARNQTRPVLKVIKRLGKLAAGADALTAHRLHHLRVENSVPLGAITQAAQRGDQAFQNFLAKDRPRIWERIADERRDDGAAHEEMARLALPRRPDQLRPSPSIRPPDEPDQKPPSGRNHGR